MWRVSQKNDDVAIGDDIQVRDRCSAARVYNGVLVAKRDGTYE
jgi:hypothetical protein